MLVLLHSKKKSVMSGQNHRFEKLTWGEVGYALVLRKTRFGIIIIPVADKLPGKSPH